MEKGRAHGYIYIQRNNFILPPIALLEKGKVPLSDSAEKQVGTMGHRRADFFPPFLSLYLFSPLHTYIHIYIYTQIFENEDVVVLPLIFLKFSHHSAPSYQHNLYFPQLIVALSSDRGLCGGIHSGIAKAVKATMKTIPNVRTKSFILFGPCRFGGIIFQLLLSEAPLTFYPSW